MVHNARIVPIGRPQGTIPQWVGDSRGRWEGDTLVVETKNFYQITSLRASSPNLRLTERFRRVDADTLVYEYTVDDPTTWTKPRPSRFPHVEDRGPIYYARLKATTERLVPSGARAVERKNSSN